MRAKIDDFIQAINCAENMGAFSKITPESYAIKIAKLFSEWKTFANSDKNPHKNFDTAFVSDGVIDPEKWFTSNMRPLYLMKEAHSFTGDCNLAKDHVLTSGKATNLWKRISLWAKGMLCAPLEFDPRATDIQYFGNEHLRSIAAINVKKYNGKSSSDDGEIRDYAKVEKEYLKRQIELCDPTVIVCCKTAKALNQVIDFGYEKQYNAGRFYHTEINNHDLMIIDYYHPANHFPEIMNYYALMEILKHAQGDQIKRMTEKNFRKKTTI